MNCLKFIMTCAAAAAVLSLGGMLMAETRDEGKQILNSRCSACHGLDRVEGADKTREQWERTVDRMISIGARVTPQEKPVLIDYLAR